MMKERLPQRHYEPDVPIARNNEILGKKQG